MNGRLYDVNLGRFLAPDNFVSDPYNTQNFNRYSYVLNNPLKFTDKSGEFIICALIGAAVGIIVNGINNAIHDPPFFQGAVMAGVTGFIGGGVASMIGAGAQAMSGIGKFAFQTLAHAHLGGMMTAMSGGNPLHGMAAGAFASVVAGGVSAAIGEHANNLTKGAAMVGAGGLSGGIGSVIAGGNFWDGMRNGLISAGLNHAAHILQEKSILYKMIKKVGIDDPWGFAKLTNAEIKAYAAKVFGDMYNEAGQPSFEVKDNLSNNAAGQTPYTVTTNRNTGCAVDIKNKGVIWLKKPVLNSYMHLTSTMGHELSHMIFNNTRGIDLINMYGNEYHRAASEVYAHSWEKSVGSIYFNQTRYNKYLKIINQYQ